MSGEHGGIYHVRTCRAGAGGLTEGADHELRRDPRSALASDWPSGRDSPSASALAPTASVPATGESMCSLDGHQFHRPSSTTVQGTSTVRTTNVSMMTPSARP